MGTFVTNPTSTSVSIDPFPDEPFTGEFTGIAPIPYDTLEGLVTGRFTQSKDYADEFMSRLTDPGGYLDQLNSIIQEYTATSITIPSINNTNPGVDWVAEVYSSPLYTALLARIVNDLQTGGTGVDAIVEAEYYARYLARTAADNDAKYREIEEYGASRGFDLPTGAMMGRLQEQANVIAANNLEASGKIMIEQADLAQKNSQFIINAAKEFEGILRDFSTKRDENSLDHAKAVATNTILLQNQVAEMELKAAIAESEAGVQGYTAEYGLRERVATALANVTMQASSSAFGAVNASAGISFGGSMSSSESFGHNESRSIGFSKNEGRSLSENNTNSHGETINESHDYTEK